jgi:hypothetical protein
VIATPGERSGLVDARSPGAARPAGVITALMTGLTGTDIAGEHDRNDEIPARP